MKRFAFVLFLVACSHNAKTSETSSPSQSGSATEQAGSATEQAGSDTAAGSDTGSAGSAGSGASPVFARGQKCGENDACPTGLECVKYYGIAGPKGPQFSSCETRCNGGAACPSGTKCITIADGPGQVCR